MALFFISQGFAISPDQYCGNLHLDSFHQNGRWIGPRIFHPIGSALCTKRQPAFWIITLDYCQILMPGAVRWKAARRYLFLRPPALGVIWTNWRRTSRRRVLCSRVFTQALFRRCRHPSELFSRKWASWMFVRPLRLWKQAIFAPSFNSKIIALAPMKRIETWHEQMRPAFAYILAYTSALYLPCQRELHDEVAKAHTALFYHLWSIFLFSRALHSRFCTLFASAGLILVKPITIFYINITRTVLFP